MPGILASSQNIKAKKAQAAGDLEDEVEYQVVMAVN